MGKRQLTLSTFSVRRDEEKIVRSPSLLFCFFRRAALLDHELAEDTAECDNREPFGLEFHEEDPPGLRGSERTELFDLAYLGCAFRVQP